MPRTYRYDHYTTLTPQPSRALKRRQKKKFAETEQAAHTSEKPKISYGKKFGETEERFQQKAEQFEELQERRAEEPVIKGKVRPIGALPTPEDPSLRANMGEILTRTRLDLRRMRNAVEDFVDASSHVLSLPAQILRTAARRFRPA